MSNKHRGKTYIENEFRSLIAAIYPGQRIGADQLGELRQAFFAGALAFRNLVMARTSPGDDLTPDDEALMQSLSNELDAFGQQLLNRALASRVAGHA